MAPSLTVSRFFACYVHLVREGKGACVEKESKSRSSGFKKCWVGLRSWMGVPGWAPWARTRGRLLAPQCKLSFQKGTEGEGGTALLPSADSGHRPARLTEL